MGWLVDEEALWNSVRALLVREALTGLLTTDEAAVVARFLDRFEKQRCEVKGERR